MILPMALNLRRGGIWGRDPNRQAPGKELCRPRRHERALIHVDVPHSPAQSGDPRLPSGNHRVAVERKLVGRPDTPADSGVDRTRGGRDRKELADTTVQARHRQPAASDSKAVPARPLGTMVKARRHAIEVAGNAMGRSNSLDAEIARVASPRHRRRRFQPPARRKLKARGERGRLGSRGSTPQRCTRASDVAGVQT